MKHAITDPRYRTGFILVTTLFFMWGLSYGLLDVLNKHFQDALHISKAQSGLLQAAYFGAYFIIALPAGMFISKKGYKAGIITGLSLYAIGALLFVPASSMMTFPFFLFALFVLACGLGFLETAANPYSSALGAPETAETRLNLSQSFNGFGQFCGPLIGGLFFFEGTAAEQSGAQNGAVTITYVAIAVVVVLLIILFARTRLPDLREAESALDKKNASANQRSLTSHREFIGGVITQFFYVAAQVGVGAFFINLTLETWSGFAAKDASYLLSIGLLAFMIGRFVSTGIMTRIPASRLLAVYGIINVALCGIVMTGVPGVASIAAIGIFFFMSIMFPTIFAMGVKNLGSKTKIGSSFMIMAIVGGAVMPYFMGKIADGHHTALSYGLPLVCFIVVAIYAALYDRLSVKTA